MPTAELLFIETPPSFNAVGFTGDRRAFTRAKKKWQTQIEWALIAEKVPRGLPSVEVTVYMRFPKRRGRDELNYSVLVDKALGDALTCSRPAKERAMLRQAGALNAWLEDDTSEFYRFIGVVFEPEPGPARTRIVLEWPDEEEARCVS
jgi:hypothetical protein